MIFFFSKTWALLFHSFDTTYNMDLFHLLGGGARFDKNRFKNDVNLFEGEKEANQTQSKKKNAAVVDPNVRSQLLDEIDFFKTTHTIVDSHQSKDDKKASKEEKKASKSSKKGNVEARNGVDCYAKLLY